MLTRGGRRTREQKGRRRERGVEMAIGQQKGVKPVPKKGRKKFDR